MIHADRSPIRHTSVTIRATLLARLRAGEAALMQRGLRISQQRLMKECLRVALRLWRGRRSIAQRNRKYNQRRGPFVIVPFYTTEALRQVSHARCHHAGITLSRLLDFAIANYLERVLESWLQFEYVGRDSEDVAIWKNRYEHRNNRADFVISYESFTDKNDGIVLQFIERTEIQPWPPPKILAA